MRFLSRITVSRFMIYALSILAVGAEARRGNNFGNGGDPVREVFNAGRIFSQDLVTNIDQIALQQVSADSTMIATYLSYRSQILVHLQESEHQWDQRKKLSACGQVSPVNANVVFLSYANCPSLASSALQAMPILLKTSWRAVAAVGDYAIADAVVELLMIAWKQVNPDGPEKAAAFSLQRPPVTGDWLCSSGGREFSVRVRKEGLLHAAWPLVLGTQSLAVQFTNFLRLNDSQTSFTTLGHLKTARAPMPARSNVVYDAHCSYQYDIELARDSNPPYQLQINMKSSGQPDQMQGCVQFRPSTITATCDGVEN